MRPSYFASCEPVIPGRAGDLWPRCVPPAPLILPFRPESNFHLSSTLPLRPRPVSPPSLLRYLNPVVVHAISCTYERTTTGTNQFFSSPRTHSADFTPFSFFDFLSLSLFSSNVAGRWRINGFDRMTCDFSGIGQNNRSDISFFSISAELFLPGLRVIRKFYFTRPSLDRAANSRFSVSRIKRDGRHVRETT